MKKSPARRSRMPLQATLLLASLGFGCVAGGRSELSASRAGASASSGPGAANTLGEAGASSEASERELEPGFVVLFDGKGTEGWKLIGAGSMVVENGYARTRGNGVSLGLWYFAEQEFVDFVLRLDFRQQALESNSGVYVRFPDPQGDVLRPIRSGYEVQIGGLPGERSTTGAFYGQQAAEPHDALLQPGDWNSLEVMAVGQEYEVTLNGTSLNRFTGRRSTRGYLGLQVHERPEDVVDFRNVRVMALP
jgi:hypothetical protein